MSSDFAIRVEGLSKCYHIYDQPRHRLFQMFCGKRKQFYREFWALKDVSFELKKGKTFGIVGRNGSGKSTLLQMICGTLNPNAGVVHVNGRIAALLELGSGFNPEFTGRENVYLNAAVYGMSVEEIDARFDDIVAFSEIPEFIDQPVKTYSSGMLMRLAFSVIVHVEPDILVIDEALSVGDIVFTQKCMRFLRNFKTEKTLLFVSHDSSAVTNLCDQAIWLKQGHVMALGSAADVVQAYHADSLPKSVKQISEARAKHTPSPLILEEVEAINSATGFNPEAPFEGLGNAKIIAAGFRNQDGQLTRTLLGGQWVTLSIVARISAPIQGIILGYTLKNRLGEVIMEDNTAGGLKHEQRTVKEGAMVQADLRFELPRLREGDYVVDFAVAEGAIENHVQHQWIYHALVVQIRNTNKVNGFVCSNTPEVMLRTYDINDEHHT